MRLSMLSTGRASRLSVRLVQLPFASYFMPSIPLTMLASVLAKRFGRRVDARVVYVNFDVAHFIGLELYDELCLSGEHFGPGLAEWFFRQVAFPDLEDNAEAYFGRFYPARDARTRAFRDLILARRRRLDELLDYIVGEHRLAEADVVGFNSTFQENLAAFAVARKVKNRNPAALTIIGGSNCESPAGEEIARHVPQIDYVFSGPGLASIQDFVQALLDNEPSACDRIDGVFSKRNCGIADPRNPASGFLRVGPLGRHIDINQRIDYDYDTYFADLERSFPEFQMLCVLPFLTSRGCWWGEKSHCTFCGMNGSSLVYQSMEPEAAVETIHSLFRYRGKARVLLCVDTVLDPKYLTEVFPRLHTPPEMVIHYDLKVPIQEDGVRVMAEAGVRYATPGFEALATSTLKLMAKGVSAFANIQLMKDCTLYAIRPLWGLLIASPGEGEEVYEKYYVDLPHLAHLAPPTGVFTIKFHRYSPYWKTPERFGLTLRPHDYYALVYPFDEATLSRLAYEFVDESLSEYKVAAAKWFNRLHERVEAWKARWSDGREQPKLFFADAERGVIRDTRAEAAIEHRVGDVAGRILLRLAKPTRLGALAAELGDIPESELAEQLRLLREKGLLFEEADRALSLVLPRDPPPMTATLSGGATENAQGTRHLRPTTAPAMRVALSVPASVHAPPYGRRV